MLNIKLFPMHWNEKHQKYYPKPRCRKCFNAMQKDNYNNSDFKRYRDKYFSKGFYGWTIFKERYLRRKDDQIKRYSIRNIWESKADNLTEVFNMMGNKQVLFKKPLKNRDHINFKKLVKRVIKDMSRNQKIKGIPDDIIQQTFYYKIANMDRIYNYKNNLNDWDKKIYDISRHSGRIIK